jgi:para-nitrobenzyl esterase
MAMMGKGMAALAVGVSLLVTGAQAQTGSQTADQVTTASGTLKGVVTGDVVAFKGIPYAAPPVGPLRWKPPQPAAAWSGVKDASAFGPVCLQPASATSFNGGEDCLTLNVFTPADHVGKKLPVMVWIHGGGFVAGSGSLFFYDGSSFARDGVILVSINYRMGRLGFFAHPALTKENPKGPLGNYGIMDQIAALKWVKANIAAFGGDPGNVTAFGESAGAISLNFLLADKVNKGLFEKAISESGFGRFDAPPIAALEKADAAFMARQGVTGNDAAAAAALRAVPAEKLMGGFSGLADPSVPRPMIDGVVIKERVDVAFAKGHQLKVPYILGGNSFEASLFAPATAAHPEAVIAQTGMDKDKAATLFGDGDTLKAAYNISTISMITEPNRDLATKDVKDGAKVWLYHFSYVPAAPAPPRPACRTAASSAMCSAPCRARTSPLARAS